MAPDSSPKARPSGPDPDQRTHSSHTFNIPYQKPAGEPRVEPARDSPKIEPIPRIPPIPPVRAGQSSSSEPSRPTPAELATGLVGRFVDEFGNILDWDGTVLARVEGDLPSMVGRTVSETGEILDEDGEVAGYVAEKFTKEELTDLGGGLRADEQGNIYNHAGAVIGKLHEPPSKNANFQPSQGATSNTPPPAPRPSAAVPNPNEIYLDVKSTYDGIQIILKIPTIFNQDHNRKSEGEDGASSTTS